jgi:NAD(P)-dependent dehydrogenase (short-subunit alcohol dehydrogenase family)
VIGFQSSLRDYSRQQRRECVSERRHHERSRCRLGQRHRNSSACDISSIQDRCQGDAQSREGKIINIGSMYSFFGSGLIPSYCAAKGAIIQLTKSMAIEFAPANVQVNAIAPGWFETEMTAPVKTMPAMLDEIMLRTPAGRWGQAESLLGPGCFERREHPTSSRGPRSTSMVATRSADRKGPADALRFTSPKSRYTATWRSRRFDREALQLAGFSQV